MAEESVHNRKVSLGGLWLSLERQVNKGFTRSDVMLKGINVTIRETDVLIILKGLSASFDKKVQFIKAKDLEHVGDAISYGVGQGDWKDDRPFDLSEWQSKNRAREL
jgi:hypothetical protein